MRNQPTCTQQTIDIPSKDFKRVGMKHVLRPDDAGAGVPVTKHRYTDRQGQSHTFKIQLYTNNTTKIIQIIQ